MHDSALLLLTVAFIRKRHMLLVLVRKKTKIAVSKLLKKNFTSKMKTQVTLSLNVKNPA